MLTSGDTRGSAAVLVMCGRAVVAERREPRNIAEELKVTANIILVGILVVNRDRGGIGAKSTRPSSSGDKRRPFVIARGVGNTFSITWPEVRIDDVLVSSGASRRFSSPNCCSRGHWCSPYSVLETALAAAAVDIRHGQSPSLFGRCRTRSSGRQWRGVRHNRVEIAAFGGVKPGQ
jgi:hypothetical protein